MQSKKVIIIGGGFGGIRAALDLERNNNVEVTLISNNKNFEYYPGLHKIVGVSNGATYEVPLETIFKDKNVEIVIDEVTEIDAVTKKVTTTKGSFSADFIILAVGSQTEYFGIAGLPEMSYGFKSVAEAKQLRSHIENIFATHIKTDKVETVIGLHMVVVGAGPNGVDLAGELAFLGHSLAKKYNITESLLTVDIVEGLSRVLPMMPESVSTRVDARLRDLGVNVFCNRDLKKEQSWTVQLADMIIGTKTLVWTAGIITNELVKKITGLQLAKKNRIIVDDYLQAKGFENFFVIGDAADTKYSGLAQTAIYDAECVAKNISRKIKDGKPQGYVPRPVAFNIGVGPRWSVMMIGGWVSFGWFPYVMRTLIDIKYFLSILPIGEVWRLYFEKKK